MIDSWVARSKRLPLHLELDLRRSYSTLEALIPHSHRWQYIDFHLEPNSHSILARVKNRLHSLKRLDLYFGRTTGTVDFCEVAPQLTEVLLSGMREPVIIKLPWDQLRICALDNGEVAHYVLQHAENLQGLHLDMSKMPMDGPPELDMPIDPHSLHTKLEILITKWNFRDPGVNLFFSSLTLPSLQTLHFHFDYLLNVDQAELAPILVRFFERSCTHLRKLKLTKIPLSPSALIECLAFSPSLVFLDIEFNSRWYTIDGELLDGLSLNHPRHVLPHLRSLTFRGLADMCIEEPMDALIASRRHINPKHDGVAMLENLTLECTPSRVEEPGPPRFH